MYIYIYTDKTINIYIYIYVLYIICSTGGIGFERLRCGSLQGSDALLGPRALGFWLTNIRALLLGIGIPSKGVYEGY